MKLSQIAINNVSTACPSLERQLKAYADAGFRQVEFQIGTIKEWMKSSGKGPAALKHLLAEYGLVSIGGFETALCVFGAEDVRMKNRELLAGNARLLSELGGGVMVVGTDGPTKPAIESLDAVGVALRELAEASPENVSIALEFNWSPIVKSIRSAKLAVDAANHPHVGILFDPAHYHCTASKFEDLTPDVVRKIVHVHVDDMRNKPGELSNCNSDRELPGFGCLDLKSIFGRLEAHGYTGKFSLEMFSAQLREEAVEAAAQRCFAALRTLIEK